MKYRLYTENKNLSELRELIGISFPSYTEIKTLGVWNGRVEEAVVFEIIDESKSVLSVLLSISKEIKRINHQEAVLVTREPVDSFLF